MKTLPTINLQYWLLIISATTLGETGGDLISQSLGLGYGGGTIFLVGLFVLALVMQVRMKIQHAASYWTVIILTSTAGTTISDYLSRSLELGYLTDTFIMLVILAIVMVAWKRSSRNMAVDAPLSQKSEIFYWMAILASSTLGTAVGDLTANGTALGFGGGVIVLSSMLAIVAALYFFTKISRIACYWAAIVITHPLGACMGDFLTKPDAMNLGNIWSSVILVVVFIVVIAISSRLHRIPAIK